MNAEFVLAAQGLTKSFGHKEVIKNLSIGCRPETRLSILGPSGCGKSTLLRILVGLEKADSGDIEIHSQPIERSLVTRHVAYLGQRPALLPWLNAHDNAVLPLRLARAVTRGDRGLARELFKAFGLEGADELMPGQLSGGMKQRVALVQALIVSSDILVLDEPFAALDDVTRRSILCQLHSWISIKRIALIMVTHSFEDAAYLSNRILFWRHAPTTPQLHEASLPSAFTATGFIEDFASQEFVELKNRTFQEYMTVNRESDVNRIGSAAPSVQAV